MTSYYSENEDDPPVYESSGEEWTATEKVRTKRRSSHRLSKKPRLVHTESTTDSESEEELKPKSRNGVKKKGEHAVYPPKVKNRKPGTFLNGSFVIAKKDTKTGDFENNPPSIWKIDGKALLQKFEPYEEDGKIRHKTTSVYTGWSELDEDLYAPITVKVIKNEGHKMVVEMNWDQVKEIIFSDTE